MRRFNFKLSGKRTAVILFMLFCLTMGPAAPVLNAKVIKNPEPTHFEKNYVPLKLVKEIPADFDEDNFFARPRALTVDDEGSLFVYDAMLKKVFKFDRNFKFVKDFVRQGQGPGEVAGVDLGFQKLYFAKDGNLYVADNHNRKIIAFNKRGEHLRDLRVKPVKTGMYLPVVDTNGNYYIISTHNGAVDMFNGEGDLLHTFLDRKDYDRFVIFEPKGPKERIARDLWLWPCELNTYYDVLPGGRFIIYLTNSSTVYIFKDKELVKQFDIWPEEALVSYRNTIDELKKKAKKDGREFNELIGLMGYFFVDKDNENYFYLVGPSEASGKLLVYKFNLDGQLLSVLYTKEIFHLMAKRNNLFYGIKEGNIMIYKEVKK